MEDFLTGSARREFLSFLNDRGAVNTANVTGALQDLGSMIFGRNHRARQLTFLRSAAFHKPRGISVQAFANRLNDIITKYEAVFGANSLGLDEESRKDIFEKSMPVSFRATFYSQEKELADITYREQVAMYSRFEAAQQISESVRGGRVGAPRQWEQIMLGPGGARARRTAGPYTAARGERRNGRGPPQQRHIPWRNGQQGFEPGGGNFRRNFAGQRDAAIPPRAMGRPAYRPRYDPVQRPFRPRFRARRDRPEPAREANVIEANRPEPLQADDDVGF